VTDEYLNNNNDESELLPLALLLWSKKYFIGALVLAFVCIGVVLALSRTPIYMADALVQLETKNSGITLSEDIANLMSNESEAITEIEIIRSRMVIGRAIEATGYDIVSTPRALPVVGGLLSRLGIGRPGWSWLSAYGWSNESMAVSSLNVTPDLLGQEFVVKAGQEAGTYSVVLADGRSVSGAVGQAVSTPEGDLKLEIASLSAPAGVEFVVKKIAMLDAISSVRRSLKVSEKGRNSNLLHVSMQHSDKRIARKVVDEIVGSYVAQNIGRSSEEAENSLEFLRTQMPKVQQDLATAEAELNDYRLQHESINLDLESAAVLERIVALDTQISQLSLEETELSRLYTRDHPRYTALLNKRSKLLAEKNELASTVQSFPETQQEILRRTRNVEVNQQIYVQLLNKKQELNVLKASTVGSVRVIDEAMSHSQAVSPNKKMIVLLCAMLGLMLGCGIVLMRFFLLRNVDTPEDIAKIGLPVYATVPFSVSQEKQSPENYILSRDNPAELTVEALRSLRTSLHFGMLENGKGIVSVTGPSPALGKSFVSANLAYLAAESGSRVLLIDADMRRGTVGQIFDIEKASAGLSEFLAGAATLEEVVHPIALTTAQSMSEQAATAGTAVTTREPELEAVLEGIKLMDSPTQTGDAPGQSGGLMVMSRGKAPPNPSELLMQDKLPEFLKQMTDQYDLVVLDTPPVLAVTDAMIIGRYSDMNLMVVRHNQTAIHEVEEVAKTFKINKVDLSGVILNGYNHKESKYGQYSYSYGYQYNYESD
jgi:tyrosine-protein kinase Etk/Wzc